MLRFSAQKKIIPRHTKHRLAAHQCVTARRLRSNVLEGFES